MKFRMGDLSRSVSRLVLAVYLLAFLTTVMEIGSDIHPFSIQKAVAQNVSCVGDFEADGDVDGKNLYSQIEGGTGVSLTEFSGFYGRIDCLKKIDNSTFTTFMSVLSEGQFTLNNR